MERIPYMNLYVLYDNMETFCWVIENTVLVCSIQVLTWCFNQLSILREFVFCCRT